MPSSKNMEKELRQAVKEFSNNFNWRTTTNGGKGHLVMNFPEGKTLRDVESANTPAVSLSPDAAQIAFFQGRFSTENVIEPMDLMVEDIDTGRRQSLGLVAQSPILLAFSPDGNKIALIAQEASTDSKLKWLKVEFLERSNKPSKLFIFSILDGTLESFDILRPDTHVKNAEIFTIALYNDQIWSPNGDEIIYQVNCKRKPPWDIEIRILSLVTKTTRSLGRGDFPAWSPVNNKIAFEGQDGNFYLINPDSSDKTLLLRPNPKNLYDLTSPILWSPDGQWLLVARGSYNDTKDLFVMDPETKVMVKIESQTEPRSSWKGRYYKE